MLLAACGGGSGGSSTTPSSLAYSFVAPVAGAKSAFSETLVDNLNNTINRTITGTVVTVNADGSFSQTLQDPSNNSITTGTVNHTFYPTTYFYDNAGHEMHRTVSLPNGSVDCVDSPHGGGAPSRLDIGQSWTATYTETCGNGAAITYSQTGSLVGTESITIPTGTYTAYKFQSTTTWTTPAGTTVTETATQWRNAAAGHSGSLKFVATFAYSGTAPAQGSVVSLTRVAAPTQ